jgi:hypothetical protein
MSPGGLFRPVNNAPRKGYDRRVMESPGVGAASNHVDALGTHRHRRVHVNGQLISAVSTAFSRTSPIEL